MSVDLKPERGIPDIIRNLDCPKDFRCYRSAFKDLCKAKDIGTKGFVECLEEKPADCAFSFQLATSHMCECPLRIYIAKNLKK